MRTVKVVAVVLCVLVSVECVYLLHEYRKQWSHNNWLDHPNKIESTVGTLFDYQILDVRTCGAIGDGVADDTLAIQACIDSLPVDGKIVFFPTAVNRDYKITSTINIGNRTANHHNKIERTGQ